MTKRDIAQAMKEIAFFLRLKDDNPYRARAYERAGQALLLCPDNVAELVAGNRLTAVDGIGPATATAITELFTTGAATLLRALRGGYPSTLVELGEVPGLSMKQILRLYEHAGIRSVAELREACLSNRLITIRGIGEKIQTRILTALDAYAKGRGYRLYADVLDEVAALADLIGAMPGVQAVTVAGDVRRKMEVLNGYEFVVTGSQKSASRLLKRLATAPNLTDAAAHELDRDLVHGDADHHPRDDGQTTASICCSRPDRQSI